MTVMPSNESGVLADHLDLTECPDYKPLSERDYRAHQSDRNNLP